MSERLWSEKPEQDDQSIVGRTPGKVAVTARLAASPTVFRAESGESAGKRDDNGVAAGAEHAVDRAAGASGSPLPDALRSRFESSLGADLSSVRVHTGSESAEAARAVGARAYTTGQDIHFGAGQFDPASAFGTHLLAHEVAHTVQQQGAAPTRQHKLEISTPQDGAEVEADRAADAIVRGETAQVSPVSALWLSRDTEVNFDEDYATPSSQMRNDGDKAVEKNREARKKAGPSRSELGTTAADVNHAGEIIGWIDEAAGPLGMLQGREAAATQDGQDDQAAGHTFVPYTEGSKALAHNNAVAGKLASFQKSASRQDFQHTFFAKAYAVLGEDYLRLKATLDVIRTQELKVVGDDAKKDIEDEKKKNPLLADAINGLKAAVTDLENFQSNAVAGVAAIASTAGTTFDMLGTETEAMKLPMPKLEDSKEQAAANAEVTAVNADLAAAKAGISTIKSVVEVAFSLATGGVGGEGMAVVDQTLANLGKKAEEVAKKIDTDKLRETSGAKGAADAGKKAATDGIEGKLADWMSNYSGRISAANGKVAALNQRVKEKYSAITIDKVRNLQAQLADQVGKLVLLQKQIEQKKAAVTDAAKKVQEQAKKEGGSGTNIGAAAQAMGSVSNFLVQADSAEQLGRQEKEQGDAAQGKMKETAGDYAKNQVPGQMGGAGGLAETNGDTPGAPAIYYRCKRASDADSRGTHDFSGYDVQEGKILFTVNEDDVDQRSVVMKDRTDEQLGNVTKWKGEATGFKTELAAALGIGPSTIK